MNDEGLDRVVASQSFLRDGWFRRLPPFSVNIVRALVQHAHLARADLVVLLTQDLGELVDFSSDIWEKPHQWTEDEIAELDAEMGLIRTSEELVGLAQAQIRDDAERLVTKKQQFEKDQRTLGLAPAHSVEALLNFMIACGLVIIDSFEQMSLGRSARLPAEVLDLTPEQIEQEDQLRWVDIYQAQVGRICYVWGHR